MLQALKNKIKDIVMRPTKVVDVERQVHIPPVAEIPLPEPIQETPLPKEYIKPEKEQPLKRRSW